MEIENPNLEGSEASDENAIEIDGIVLNSETDAPKEDEVTDEVVSAKELNKAIIPQDDEAENSAEAEQTATAKLVQEQRKRSEPVVEPTRVIDPLGHKSDQVLLEDKYNLSPEAKREQALRDLRKAQRNNEVLVATVESIVTTNGLLRIGVMWNGIEVVFSKETFFEPEFSFGSDYDTLSNSEKANREMAFARYQLGAHIPFCIEKIANYRNEEGKNQVVVTGSKRKAMQIMREYYFFGNGEEVKVGDIATAHVFAVNTDWALIECLGCEYRLDAYSLNDSCVQNCADWVRPGDSIKVRIRKIHLGEDKSVKIVVTGRLFVAPETISAMKIDGTYLGQVDAYNAKKNTYSVVLLNGVLASVRASDVMYNIPITIGDRVSVKVKRVTDTHVIGAAMKL